MTLFMVNSAELIIIPEGYLALSNIGLSRDNKLRGTRLFSSSILMVFQYACRTVRPDFRRLPIGIYIDKHVFTVPYCGHVLRNTPPNVYYFHSNKIYHHLKTR